MENLRSLEPEAKISHSYKKKKSVFLLGFFNPMHPLFEYDHNGKNYDRSMTNLDPKLGIK